MLKSSGSIYKFLFATFLVFFCFNDKQLVYASNLVLDKDHLNAIVEVPKVDSSQTPATGSSTATHSFDLEFDVGEASEYPEQPKGKSFTLAIGSACKIDMIISKNGNDRIFNIDRAFITEIKSLTITNEKIITISKLTSQGSSTLCDPQISGSGGSVVLENPASDPSKSTVKLTISGDATTVAGFKLTSSAQIYVSPNSNGNKGDSSNGNGSGDGSMSEKEKLGDKIGNICWLLAGVLSIPFVGIIIYLSMKKCKFDDDDKTENKKGNKKKKRKNESKV